MAEYQPKYFPGDSYSLTATGPVTGGRLVTGAGTTADADALDVVGVANHDAVAGGTFTVFSGGVQNLTAAAAIAAGDLVKAAADGTITPYTDGTDSAAALLGIALAAAESGALVAVKFIR